MTENIPPAAQDALEAFSNCPGWEQRARLLMQWGERLEPLSDEERREDNRVHGCESLVWLLAEQRDGKWHFRATSDARLLRGLIAVLLVRVEGFNGEELAALDLVDRVARAEVVEHALDEIEAAAVPIGRKPGVDGVEAAEARDGAHQALGQGGLRPLEPVGVAFGEAVFEMDHPVGLRGGFAHAGEALRRPRGAAVAPA